jgi:tetratricopeptide (TPR) repeat protein
MKTHVFRSALAAGLLSFFAAGAPVGTSAQAATADTKETKEPPVSKAVGKPLSEAVKLLQAKDYPGALAKVKEAQAIPDRTPFDDYKINQILGFISINMGDHATATTAFEAMAESPAVELADKKEALHNAILLSNEAKHYQKVIQYAQMADSVGALDDKTLTTLAEAYYFTNDFAHAQTAAQRSVDASTTGGKIPERSALDVIFTAQVKQNDQAGAAKTLEQLATDYGSAEDWGQTIDIALGTKGMRDLDALNLSRLRLAAGGKMKAEDYSLMGNVALQLNYPVEAVAVFDQGIAAGTLTASGKTAASLAAARPKAANDRKTIGEFDALAQKHPTGDFDLKLAETYYGYGRYADAETAARRAMTKGGVKDTQEAPMVLGMALARQGKNAEAADVFGKISGAPALMKTAHLWLLYVQRKYGVVAAH